MGAPRGGQPVARIRKKRLEQVMGSYGGGRYGNVETYWEYPGRLSPKGKVYWMFSNGSLRLWLFSLYVEIDFL